MQCYLSEQSSLSQLPHRTLFQSPVDQGVECPSHDVDVSHENTTFRNLIFERKSEFSVTHLFISTLTIFLVSYNQCCKDTDLCRLLQFFNLAETERKGLSSILHPKIVFRTQTVKSRTIFTQCANRRLKEQNMGCNM